MKILIADDELLVRISIQKLLNDLGIMNQDILQAENGPAMLRALTEERITIALVDIKMPDMTGLEAIQSGLGLSPHTSFYILTGYGKFEYAKQAIQLGVKDFLLKPLSVETLSKLIDKERKSLENESIELRNSYTSRISTALLTGKASGGENLYCIPCLCVSDNPILPGLDILYQLEAAFQTIKVVILSAADMIYIVFCSKEELRPKLLLPFIKKFFQQILNQKENDCLSVFCIPEVYMADQLKPLFGTMADYSTLRIVYGFGRIYLLDLSDRADIYKLLPLCTLFTELTTLFSSNSYFDFVSSSWKLYQELEVQSGILSMNHYKNMNQYIACHFVTPKYSLSSQEEIRLYFEHISESLLVRNQKNRTSLSEVIEYVDQHFTEDISINQLAEQFHITPNYLSSQFRKETGMRFTDYFTGLRILKAKKLLAETPLQVKQIAAEVGYYTTSHFIKLFVKYEGMTPVEFRNSKEAI